MVDNGYILGQELILFLLVPQILAKHTINYFQIVKVMKCMECTFGFSKNGVTVMTAILNKQNRHKVDFKDVSAFVWVEAPL